MLKNKSVLEVTIEEKLYTFACDSDAPLGAVHDALCQMRAFVVQKIADLDKPKEPEPEAPK
jgi:hypothetical protein